jgi:hypothetical protein
MPEKRKLSIAEVDAAIKHLEDALELLNIARGSEPNKKKPNPNHSTLKIGFISFYKGARGVEYVWSAKDATHLNLLIGKIESLINISESKNVGTVEDIFKIILSKLKGVDKFIWENLTIPIINSKFNEIIAKIKNPNANSKELDDYKK